MHVYVLQESCNLEDTRGVEAEKNKPSDEEFIYIFVCLFFYLFIYFFLSEVFRPHREFFTQMDTSQCRVHLDICTSLGYSLYK